MNTSTPTQHEWGIFVALGEFHTSHMLQANHKRASKSREHLASLAATSRVNCFYHQVYHIAKTRRYPPPPTNQAWYLYQTLGNLPGVSKKCTWKCMTYLKVHGVSEKCMVCLRSVWCVWEVYGVSEKCMVCLRSVWCVWEVYLKVYGVSKKCIVYVKSVFESVVGQRSGPSPYGRPRNNHPWGVPNHNSINDDDFLDLLESGVTPES